MNLNLMNRIEHDYRYLWAGYHKKGLEVCYLSFENKHLYEFDFRNMKFLRNLRTKWTVYQMYEVRNECLLLGEGDDIELLNLA